MLGVLVRYERRGAVGLITMDDGKVNVMSVDMQDQIHRALDVAEQDGVAVVLKGREGIFSAGFDLRVMSGSASEKLAMVMGGLRLAERVFSFPGPVVMACTGHAIAMGAFLLLCGDYRLGVDGPYRLVANEVALGMYVPRTCVEIMRHRLIPAALDRAVGLAEEFSGEKALACGFLDELADPGEVDDVAMIRAETFAALDREAHRVSKMRARAGAIEAVHRALAEDDRNLASRLGPA